MLDGENVTMQTVFPRFDLGHLHRGHYFPSVQRKVYATIDRNGVQECRAIPLVFDLPDKGRKDFTIADL